MRLEARAGVVAFRGIAIAVTATGETVKTEIEKVALYLLVTGCNVPGALAGEIYGCSKQYVSKALRQVEDRRDDDEPFNRALEDLERQLGMG